MQLKEGLRKILHPRIFYFLVDIKNAFFPNESYKKVADGYQKSTGFYKQFISKNDLVFDIGANYGNRVRTFLALHAKVIAVEPQRKCVKFLKAMYSDAVILEKGVGGQPGEMDFYASENSALSTFSQNWINKVKVTNRFENAGWQAPVKVQITTLDELILKYGVPAFVKIDVEGFEPEVLNGLNTAVDSLSFEYAVPENMDELSSCLQRLKMLGNYVANFSKGESMDFHLKSWMNLDEFLAYIETDDFIETHAGDVYVKLNRGE
jgi:FkbM family methyltransferase